MRQCLRRCQPRTERAVARVAPISTDTMQNILILKLGALGDVVMATPLIDAILQAHPDSRVSLLTTPAFAPLFAAWPRLTVHAVPRHGGANFLRMLRFIRHGCFARLYDLQGNDRSGLLSALSGISERVGNHPRWPYTHHPAQAWDGTSHIFVRMCEVLASAGVTVRAARPLLPATADVDAEVARWQGDHGLAPGSFVLLHAGASAARPEKRWPGFADLARALLANGHQVVWLGGEDDRALNRRLAAAGGIDATAAFSIPALAAIGREAAFAVTNDSGPMHVLAAAGIPVFGLFGPSDWRRNHALGQADHVIACVDHAPAYRDAATGDCLAEVGVELVWSKLCAAGLVTAPAPV